jgi:hypothetical protein
MENCREGPDSKMFVELKHIYRIGQRMEERRKRSQRKKTKSYAKIKIVKGNNIDFFFNNCIPIEKFLYGVIGTKE